jgi:hypothetical protein
MVPPCAGGRGRLKPAPTATLPPNDHDSELRVPAWLFRVQSLAGPMGSANLMCWITEAALGDSSAWRAIVSKRRDQA